MWLWRYTQVCFHVSLGLPFQIIRITSIHPLARLALEWGSQQVWIAQTAQEAIRQKTELKEGVGTLVNPNLVLYDIILWSLRYQIDTMSLHISYSPEQVQDNSRWTPSRSPLCISFYIQREGIQRVYLSKRGCQGLVLHKSRWKWKTCRRAETMGILWERMPGTR